MCGAWWSPRKLTYTRPAREEAAPAQGRARIALVSAFWCSPAECSRECSPGSTLRGPWARVRLGHPHYPVSPLSPELQTQAQPHYGTAGSHGHCPHLKGSGETGCRVGEVSPHYLLSGVEAHRIPAQKVLSWQSLEAICATCAQAYLERSSGGTQSLSGEPKAGSAPDGPCLRLPSSHLILNSM